MKEINGNSWLGGASPKALVIVMKDAIRETKQKQRLKARP
jgi:hypothetical protein